MGIVRTSLYVNLKDQTRRVSQKSEQIKMLVEILRGNLECGGLNEQRNTIQGSQNLEYLDIKIF